MKWLAALFGAVAAFLGAGSAAQAAVRSSRAAEPTLRAKPPATSGGTPPPKRGAGGVGGAVLIANTPRTWTLAQLKELADRVAARAGVPRELVYAIAEKESAWNVNARGKNADGTTDLGLFQLNSRWIGKPGFPATVADAMDPEINAAGAEKLLREARVRWGDLTRVVVDYHSGYSVAKDWPASSTGGLPGERVGYVNDVFRRMERYAGTINRIA